MMNSQEPETHPRGDSDDEIAELRFQALLTKRENEAEISQAHEPCPFPENVTHTSINQPLSNFRGQPQYNYRGRGRGPYYKPYLQTFSQQIASQSVNSSNIVVLTSSDADESKQATYPQEWQLGGRAAWEQKGYNGQGGRWPGGGGQRMPIPSNGHIGIQQPAPRLILPQDKYAPQSQMVKDPVDQNKAKLSARMRRLQGSDSDSEDSESDSSDDSSSSDSSSDSNSSSSDTSSSDSDSDSDTNQTLVASKKGEKPQKKDKVTKPKENQSKHPSQTSSTKMESSQESNSHTFSGSPSKPRSPTKSMSTTELPLSLPDPKKVPHSPVLKKRSSRSPSTTEKRSSHHYSQSPPIKAKRSSRSPLNSYSQRLRSKSPRGRKSRSFSPRRYSRSPRRSRTPLRRYASRSPYSRKATSPLRGTRSSYGRYSKSPVPKKFSKSPVGRYRSRSRSPYLTKRFRSRSPYSRKSRSPLPPRKGSRSPLPLRRLSRSPLPPRLRSKSPYTTRRYTSRSPRPIKRYSSKSPPPASKGYRPKSRSPYGGKRYGTPSPRLYSRRSSSFSPKRHRIGSPRPSRPLYRSKSPRPLSPRSPQRRRSSFSPVKKFKSRSPIGRPCISPREKQSPHRLSHSPGAFTSPQKIKRIGSISPKPFSAPEDRFSHVREKSPFTSYAPHSPIPPKRYEPPRKPASPPPRYMIGGAEPQFERRPMTTQIFTGQPSSRGHNYGNRPPSPYFRERPLSEEGLQPLDRGPPRPYGMRLDRPEPFIGRGNRGGHFELNLPPGPKRYPNPPDPQHPPWHPHRAEPGPLSKPPPGPHMSHYPPKFAPMEPNYVNRPPFPQPPLQHPPLPDKGWPPNVPSRPFEDNFGPPHLQDRNHHRADRFQECGPPEHPRGRGRGFRGQRGTFRGVHARLGGRNSWGPPSLLGGAPGAHEPPPFGEPYIRERQERRAGPPIAMEQDVAFMDRRPPPFEPPPPLHPPSLNQKSSPGHPRIPRGPKTPPYSPKREPSPLEWQKRGQMNLKDRTPSLSPSPSRRYPNEPYLSRQVNQSNKQPRERDSGRMMESYDAPNQRRGRYGSHKFIHDSNRADQRMENREYEERRKPQMDKCREAEERRKPLMDNNREAEERRKPLMDNKKDLEERRKPLRGDELRSRDNDVRKTHSSERGKPPPLEQRASNQEKDREVDNRRRSPHQEKSKSSSGDVRLQLDVKDDLHHRNKRERDTEQDPRNRREREREKESEEHRNKGERQTDREQNRQRELDKDQNRQRESDKDQNRQRELDKDQNRQRESDKDQNRQRELDKDQNRQREKSDQRERSDQSDQKKRRENESKLKREREPEPDGKDKKEVKPKIDNYEVDEGKVKKPTESEKEPDRGNPSVGEVSRESVKHPSERRPSKERKPSKEVETTQTMKEADTKKLKDDAASDDADKKKKRKKKHREDEKSSKSSKKKKKEKKKKKDSKKKLKKGTKESDTDDSSPKKKKKSSYTLSGGPRESDLRQMLTKKDESPREGALKRRKDIEDKLLDRKKRREDSREPDRDWKMASRARDRVDDRGRKDERTHYRDDRRAPERRDRSDDTNRGNKGLVVTLGSGANRHVMSSGNPSSDKGTKRDSGGPRIPVHMRLGPGSGPESASDEAKKLRRPLDTRRKPGVAAGRPRHQGMKGASKGSNR